MESASSATFAKAAERAPSDAQGITWPKSHSVSTLHGAMRAEIIPAKECSLSNCRHDQPRVKELLHDAPQSPGERSGKSDPGSAISDSKTDPQVEKLEAQKAQENVCKIIRRNGKYLWASRENEELVLVESGLF